MQIVSETSPLIILKKSGAIRIMEKLFDEVIISRLNENLRRDMGCPQMNLWISLSEASLETNKTTLNGW